MSVCYSYIYDTTNCCYAGLPGWNITYPAVMHLVALSTAQFSAYESAAGAVNSLLLLNALCYLHQGGYMVVSVYLLVCQQDYPEVLWMKFLEGVVFWGQ